MRVVLVHFHLDTGGVTTVVRQQVDALIERGHDLLLLSGSAPNGEWPAPVEIIPGLAYDSANGGASPGADETADTIFGAINRAWPDRLPDLVHVHNPTLAKNRRLQAVLKKLQRNGLTLLCQLHDFAEDGRPTVYFQEPYVADCHYAVVNGRDRDILTRCGLTEKGVHYLPNAVPPLEGPQGNSAPKGTCVLYPVRAIRRKNIGEALLLQLCAFSDIPLTITLPPTSAADLPSYEMWRHYVDRRHLPVTFEAGLHNDFRQLVADSRYLISTSINEGFGFSFLEAWTAGKALWGRRLPDICDDFSRKGIDLGHLYSQLPIPLEWVDADRLKQMWQATRADAFQRYAMMVTSDQLDEEWQEMTCTNRIDFGLLSERFQRAVLDRVIDDPKNGTKQLQAINPGLLNFGVIPDSRRLIEINRRAILEAFSLTNYANRLVELYENVLSTPVEQGIDKTALARAFMAPSRFSLLKWSAFDG